jgi:hypothetical protein
MRSLISFAAAAAIFAVASSGASAAGAPYCRQGEVTAFHFGFAQLKAQLAVGMGEPEQCEHRDGSYTLQWAITGIAYYDPASNLVGFNLMAGPHLYKWTSTSHGLLFWESESWIPPVDAVSVSDDHG